MKEGKRFLRFVLNVTLKICVTIGLAMEAHVQINIVRCWINIFKLFNFFF